MKQWNPIRDGVKKYGSSRAYFDVLKERAKTGLTAMEWDWYRARQKEWEPDVLAAEMAAADHRIALGYARKLSIEDLQMILAEKSA